MSGLTTRPGVLLAALVTATAVWAYLLAFRTSGPTAGDCGRPRVRASDPRVGPVYVVVLLLLTAVLVHLSPWYAFLALAGYAHSYEYLPGRWRYVGIAAMAVLHAHGTIGGGFNELGPLLVVAWAVITVLIATVATTFTVMGARTAELSQRRARTIADLNETNRRLAESLDESAELHTRLLAQAREAGVADERARMAREIHDTLAQGLTGIVTQLEAADSADEAARRRHVDTARALARESLTEARRSVDALAPGRLAGARLPDAITDMAKEWAETAEVGVHVEVTGDPVPLLTLSYMDDVVVLDVRDDGTGFDPAADRTGFGLTAMEQQVRRVSGTFTVESAPGDGTAISASVPAIPAERGEA